MIRLLVAAVVILLGLLLDVRSSGGKETANHFFDEWKECRVSIDRFDKIVVDLRKYGFTLITGALTAQAVLLIRVDVTATVPQLARAAVGVILLLFIAALFLLDKYYYSLLRGAVRRAHELEEQFEPKIEITRRIAEYSHRSLADEGGTVLYFIFSFIAFIIAMVSLVPITVKGTLEEYSLPGGMLPVILIIAWLLVVVVILFYRSRAKEKQRWLTSAQSAHSSRQPRNESPGGPRTGLSKDHPGSMLAPGI